MCVLHLQPCYVNRLPRWSVARISMTVWHITPCRYCTYTQISLLVSGRALLAQSRDIKQMWVLMLWLTAQLHRASLSLPVRELKHRTMKEPDQPKFQLQEYVDKEMRTAGCCRSQTSTRLTRGNGNLLLEKVINLREGVFFMIFVVFVIFILVVMCQICSLSLRTHLSSANVNVI